jgi:thioredoxin reductase (NADPH)
MSDDAILWGVSLAVAGGIVLYYFLSFRRRRHADRERKEEAARLGFDKPRAQFPFVDVGLCVGCGSCVKACPEGDVLGIVGGVATVINGLRCVGHARCEQACPTGAIQVGLGDLKSRADVPVMDEWQETNVPGVFVAGELTGMALVKNAVLHGRKAVERIAQRAPRERGGPDVWDIVIVGAGPAGLTAGALAREKGLSAVLLEQEADLGGTIFHYPRRKLVLVQALEIPFLGRLREGEYTKEELLERLEELRRRADLDVRFGQRVLGASRLNGHLEVRTTDGAFAARHVILALGRRGTPRKLGVPGEERPEVVYQLADAASYEAQRLLVVGGGDSAVEAALALAGQRGNRVTLSYRRDRLVRIKKKNEERVEAALRSGRVQALFGSQVLEIGDRSVKLKVKDEEVTLPTDYVFVFAGGEPPFGLLRQAGIRFGGEEEAGTGAALTPPGAGGPSSS